MADRIIIDVSSLYAATETAKLGDLSRYEAQVCALAGAGNDVTITGPGPVWLYLRIAHLLHGKVRSMNYDSPTTGKIVIYDHNPY